MSTNSVTALTVPPPNVTNISSACAPRVGEPISNILSLDHGLNHLSKWQQKPISCPKTLAGLCSSSRQAPSPTSYLGPTAIPNLFRGGKVTSGLSALRLVESKCIGGVPDDGTSGLVWEIMMGGGNGSEWEVDSASALSLIIAAQ
ncbi:hypothetical protein Tco_0626047 [Tanacetum coccineum]|uniref:Uncharacterized protein n=1 Tax=Tanacetum coccineum TaxID=301880 RepID=A0ABQ4WIH9_9ASTR